MEKSTKTPRPTIKRPKASSTGNGKETFALIALDKIRLSPINYRSSYDTQALEAFAAAIKEQGIISPLTLRPLKNDRYELVAGERRYRAAGMAGLKEVPAVVRPLTDHEVTEIQLAENLQRENPHPLHEARAVSLLLQAGKTIAEIAARLGKSKGFVYQRIKLAELTEDLQELFLADKITVGQAVEIAALSPEAQQAFFEDCCADWQDEDFELDMRYALHRYQCDLNNAPFAIDDPDLFPEVGACSQCSFNSATLKTLFPDLTKEATCTNRDCYATKCNRQLENSLKKAAGHAVVAVIYGGWARKQMDEILAGVSELAELPRYDWCEVTVVDEPEPPEKDDYTDSWNVEEGQEPEFDEEGFQMALQEYEEALETYRQELESGRVQRAVFLRNGEVSVIYFSPEKKDLSGTKSVTAKEVQQAIKEGKATVELLEKEIERINHRELRSAELDEEKVQAKVLAQFTERFSARENNNQGLTSADQVAARLIVYQSLDYHTRYKVDQVLFPEGEALSKEAFYRTLLALNEDAYSFLIRMATATNPQSKYPSNINGWCLYAVAKEAGADVSAVEREQAAKAAARKDRIEIRIKDLERKIARLMWRTGQQEKS